MASIRSLGISTPSAIPYLVAEGILPTNHKPSDYCWQRISGASKKEGEASDELLITKTCVVWSRGGVLRRTFRFDLENEPVKLALFTTFASSSKEPVRNPAAHGSYRPSAPLDPKVPAWERRRSADEHDDSLQENSGRTRLGSNADLRLHEDLDEGRALVTILRTQAHINFLTGTNHIVHLPFEVTAAFSTPYGLILQRQSVPATAVPSTPQPPLAPANSFSLSQLGSSRVALSSQTSAVTVGLSLSDYEPSILSSLLKSVSTQTRNENHDKLPNHFYLQDPLTELSVVLAAGIEASDPSVGEQRVVAENPLDTGEIIIYLSSKSEIEESESYGQPAPSLFLAVSLNKFTGACNIWRVTKRQLLVSKTPRKRFSNAANGALSRRRSSYGTGTGTATPAVRASLGPRESFGGLKDVIRDPTLVRDDADLASQLDPAFEVPGLATSSSRRITALLARSDVTLSRDPSAIADFISGHTQGAGTRRSTSFGGERTSFGKSVLQNHLWRKNNSSLHIGNGAPEITDHSMDGQSVASEIEDETAQGRSNINDPLPDHQRRIVLDRVHTLKLPNFEQSLSSIDTTPTHPSVFTLHAPNSRFPDKWELVLCIVDRERRCLSVVYVDAILSSRITKSYQPGCELVVKVKDCRTGKGVIDACKISDGVTSRIVVLGSTEDGSEDLSLQSPWSMSLPILLPSRLLVRHPYHVDDWNPATRRRDGSIKRVLSNGPGRMCALSQCLDAGQVDFQDSEGTLHRLEIQLSPRDTFVSKAVLTCQAVLQSDGLERDPILRTWWEVKAWICSQFGRTLDSDWTAFVVVVFLMFATFLDEDRKENTFRTKRKTRSLRSSMSATIDLESFDTMISGESGDGNSLPRWLQGSSWQWAICNDALGMTRYISERESSIDDSSLLSFPKKLSFLPDCVKLARDFLKTQSGVLAAGEHGYLPTASCNNPLKKQSSLARLLLALHLLGEELKLDILSSNHLRSLTPVLVQMGGWLKWEAWGWGSSSFYMSADANMDRWLFDTSKIRSLKLPEQVFEPPSILKELEAVANGNRNVSFPTLCDIVSTEDEQNSSPIDLWRLTPRTLLALTLSRTFDSASPGCIDKIEETGVTMQYLDTFPEGFSAPLRSALARRQAEPGVTPSMSVLALIGRDDIAMLGQRRRLKRPQSKVSEVVSHVAVQDFHAACNSTLEVEQISSYDGSAELDRQAITRMIFKDDQRFGEAAKLLHPLKPALARCVAEPEWSDTDLLEAQQEMVKVIAVRTLSFSAGRGMLFYSARFPLLTEKFPIHGFTLSCVMKPSNTTVTADRNVYTEEKVSWAFFHAGVEAGLSISKKAKGVDTSWILFNKPQELSNRHAGFLLALGLNGHLKSIAKWVAFKYLTPKHTMTSIGLLLGLAASYLGTMDTLVTRLLSIHVTRMLPPGAAELNLSPLTQTTGIMAIGLLYCGSQHRRMSEVMLSEMESIKQDDSTNPMDDLRDEGYRLAAGFALGYINLGQGMNLKGLYDMRLVERLLALAVATKRVDVVHILDKATAAATMAITLIFMKTEDAALARKIDIPDTIHQFEYVRPDVFLLRTVARHLIMWNSITPTTNWIRKQLPKPYQAQARLSSIRALHTGYLPLLNIIAGICLSIGIRFAGSARQDVRDLLGHYLDHLIRISRLPALNYDSKLTRITARNCQDTVALAAASVMAGTGDVYLFRRLRSLHGRTDPETPFGSQLAAHQAIGLLFLGGGTYTLNTSDIAVASLLCAFYPLFPTTVQDNKSHLQAFRHFWVLASEPRCLIVRNVENLRPMALPIIIVLRSGKELEANAPCLLPELDSISSILSNDPRFWRVILDFANNPGHLSAFKRHQSIFVRRRAAYDARSSVFAATMQALNDRQLFRQMKREAFEWIFELHSFASLDKAKRSLVLPAETSTILHNLSRVTAVDDQLCLTTECLESTKSERLWNLRVLFAWADNTRRGVMGPIGKELIEALRAKIALMWNKGA